jgi:hypothetical protein
MDKSGMRGTYMKRLGDHPLTNAEKQRRRVAVLNAIAQANGFKTWGKLETHLKDMHEEATAPATFAIVIPPMK